MEDVEANIQNRMDDIREKVRHDLSNLTGEYLRDIIEGEYQSVSPEQLRDIDSFRVDNIFKRIPDEILPEEDKSALKQIVSEIASSGQIDDKDRVIADFLNKLVNLYIKQQEDEKDIREFVQICNANYLSGKQFIYNDVSFNVYVKQESEEEHIQQLPLQSLSSGEKQIVSLFSHLYLTDSSNFFVVIDEPELSLSVPWQRHFLPDILRRASGLVAVTHSPFIYDNELQPYAHSLEEFTEPFEFDPSLEDSGSVEDDLLLRR